MSSKNPSKFTEAMFDVCTPKIITETLVSVPNVVTKSNVENLSSPTKNVKNSVSVSYKSNVDRYVKRSSSACIDPQVSAANSPSPVVKNLFPVSGTHDEQETTQRLALCP